MLLLMVLISAAIGFGSAFYIERKIHVRLKKKSQRLLSYVAMISFGLGFSGFLNQILSQPMLGLAIDFNKAATHLLINMLVLPAIIYAIVWVIGFFVRSNVVSPSQISPVISSNSEPVAKPNLQVAGWKLDDIKLNDEELGKIYATAYDEIESNSMDKGLWARCFAVANGDINLVKAKYIEMRVSNLSVIALENKKLHEADSTINLLISRANGNDVDAILELGLIKYKGLYNQQRHLVEAFDYLKKAAYLGSARAQNMLSSMFWNGEGTDKNKSYAHAWAVVASLSMPEVKSNVETFQREMTSKEVYDSDNLVKTFMREIDRNSYAKNKPVEDSKNFSVLEKKGQAIQSDGNASQGVNGKYFIIALGVIIAVYIGYDLYKDDIQQKSGLLSLKAKKIYEFYPHTVWDNCNSPYQDKPVMTMDFIFNEQSKEIIAKIDYEDKGVVKQDFTRLEPCSVVDEKNWSCGGNVLAGGVIASKYIMADGKFTYVESSYSKCPAKIIER